MCARFEDYFTLGYAPLDDEHRLLITALDEYCESSKKGSLDLVFEMAKHHFASEVEEMRKLGYPEEKLQKHQAEHKKVFNNMVAYSTDKIESCRKIRTALLAHIITYDLEFHKWYKEAYLLQEY